MTVTHNNPGIYAVSLPGLNLSGGTVQVTAYGSGPEYCKVQSWGGGTVNVLCFTPPTSTAPAKAADSQFTLSFTTGSPSAAPSFGYAWANQPSAASYTPSTTYQRTATRFAEGQLTNQGWATIQRASAGQYTVTFPGLNWTNDAKALDARSNAMVTAYGSSTDYCTTVWDGDANSGRADVQCYDERGAAKDSQFVVAYSSTVTR